MSSRDVPPPPETEKPRAPSRPEGTVTDISDEVKTSVNELLAAPEFAERIPKLIAQGGENLVFSFEGRERYQANVCKVNFFMTIPMIKDYLAARTDLERQQVLEKGEQNMRIQMTERARKLDIMRSYFGREAIPVERTMILVLPISPSVLKALRVSDKSDKKAGAAAVPNFFPLWITLQRKVAGIESAISLDGDYIERPLLKRLHGQGRSRLDDLSEDDAMHVYNQEQQLLTERAPASGRPSPEEMEDIRQLIFQAYPNLERVWHEIIVPGSGFRRTLQETVETMIRYIREKKESLDMVGAKNVALMPSDVHDKTSWKVKMLDSLGANPCTIPFALDAAQRLQREEKLSLGAFLHLANVLNTVRLINALAILTSTPDRLYFKELASMDTEQWIEEWKRHSIIKM